MNTWVSSLDSQMVLVVAASVVTFLLFILLLRILKASFGLMLTILAIALILQYVFGISPSQLWSAVKTLPQDCLQLVQGLDLNILQSWLSD